MPFEASRSLLGRSPRLLLLWCSQVLLLWLR